MTPEECTASPRGVFATTSGPLVILLTNSPFDQDFLSHPFIPEVTCVHTYMLKGILGEGMRGETGALSPLRCGRETYPESADCSLECYLPFFGFLCRMACSNLYVEIPPLQNEQRRMAAGWDFLGGLAAFCLPWGRTGELEFFVLVQVHGKSRGREGAAGPDHPCTFPLCP